MRKSVVSMVFVVVICGGVSGCDDEHSFFDDLFDPEDDGDSLGTGDGDPVDTSTNMSVFEDLAGETVVLKVDRIADGFDPYSPSHQFSEDDYSPVEDGENIRFEFDSDLTLLTVDDVDAHCPAYEDGDGRLRYVFGTIDNDYGTRVIIWVDENDNFQVEYTLFGIDDPISVRGAFSMNKYKPIFEDLEGETVVLKVDRIADGFDPYSPWLHFSEDDYSPVEDGEDIRFEFDSDLTLLTVDDVDINCPVYEDGEGRPSYEFGTIDNDYGTRVIIWVDENDIFQAEYTLFGIDDPTSVRGVLTIV
jgi:hypothetical protein